VDVSDPYYFLPAADDMDNEDATATDSKTTVLPSLLKLRRICNFMEVSSTSSIAGLKMIPGMNSLFEQSAKLKVVDAILGRLHSAHRSDKIVIVSNFLDALDSLARLVTNRRMSYLRLDGSTPADLRQRYVEEFNRSDSDKKIFLLSSKAGGVGINL
jgi:SNF2 family DNA or RNA helicase